jgi:hypothetical protein
MHGDSELCDSMKSPISSNSDRKILCQFKCKKSKCLKCGKKCKNASELRDHERAAHTYHIQPKPRRLTHSNANFFCITL